MHVNVTFMRVFRHFHTILNYLVPTAECNGPCTQVKDVTHTPGELQIIESKCLSKFLTFLTIICPLSHSSKNILVPQVVFKFHLYSLPYQIIIYVSNKEEVFYHLKNIIGFAIPLTLSLARCAIQDTHRTEHALCDKACQLCLHKIEITMVHGPSG